MADITTRKQNGVDGGYYNLKKNRIKKKRTKP